MLGSSLQGFKRTAYYPFAASHAGPFAGWFACFLLFQGMCIAVNRQQKCVGHKKADDAGDAAPGGDPYGGGAYPPPGAYGPPPGAYGPPPGAYGPPPGGKGPW